MSTPARPDFFIVGAPKCGTSSFHTYLGQHPEIFMSHDKEPTFFGSDIRRVRTPYPTLDAYLALFRDAREGQRVGESSVAYLGSRRAPEEIYAFDPESQIVIMLRNPVDVMYSLHGHLVFIGEEELADFGEALDAEERRATEAVPPYLLYRNVVRFGEQVERWLTVFGASKVHTIIHDDLTRNLQAEFEGTLRFLEVDTTFRPSFTTVNAGRRPRSQALHRFLLRPSRPARAVVRAVVPSSWRTGVVATLRDLNGRTAKRPPLAPELRRTLSDELAPEVARLGRLLSRDLSHWSSA